MHSLNGLEVEAWAKDRYERMISDAQRDLRAEVVARERAGDCFGWLRNVVHDWRSRFGEHKRTDKPNEFRPFQE